MIMTVDELKTFVSTNENDKVLEARLQALELLIRKYANNNFQDRNRRFVAPVDAVAGFQYASELFKAGDTVQVSESHYNDGLYVITEVDLDNGHIKVDGELTAEPVAMVTKVVYPMDIKLGAANMLSWDLNNRDKVGVQSETLSRHSVTYFNMDALCTSGLEIEGKNKENGTFALTMECYAELSPAADTLPYHIYLPSGTTEEQLNSYLDESNAVAE